MSNEYEEKSGKDEMKGQSCTHYGFRPTKHSKGETPME